MPNFAKSTRFCMMVQLLEKFLTSFRDRWILFWNLWISFLGKYKDKSTFCWILHDFATMEFYKFLPMNSLQYLSNTQSLNNVMQTKELYEKF